MFLPFLCCLPVSVPVNKFAGKRFQREWPQMMYWRTVLESILSTFAVNIPTWCLILSAVFIQAQTSDTSWAVWPVKTKEQTLNVWHMQGTRNISLIIQGADALGTAIGAPLPIPDTPQWCKCGYHCWRLWKGIISSGARNKEAVQIKSLCLIFSKSEAEACIAKSTGGRASL